MGTCVGCVFVSTGTVGTISYSTLKRIYSLAVSMLFQLEILHELRMPGDLGSCGVPMLSHL
jgi:hypothetical protein